MLLTQVEPSFATNTVNSSETWPIRIVIASVAIAAALAFFYRLGANPLNDWDEAWHAEVSREILTSGDWLTLHYRGDVYFNKPPLTFWIRAVAFRALGVTDTAARLPSACFGWASVMLVAWFAIRRFGLLAGALAAFILCGSWLFVTYHAGRSGETDGALVFFNVATFICLWRAVHLPRWFYIAGVFTALAWMTKGATAYLPWAAAAVMLIDRHAPRWTWKHALGGFALGFALAAPWQIAMLARHGRAFFHAFYIHEAMEPTFGVSEGHGGDWTFHLAMLRLFFQPWLSLAGAAGLAIVFLRDRRPAARWVLVWAIVTLGGCSLIPTKLIWYAAPALPPLAILAGIAAAGLARRRGGALVLAAATLLAIAHFRNPSWLAPRAMYAAGLTLVAAIVLGFSMITKWRWELAIGALLAFAPVTLDSVTITRVLQGDGNPEDWLERRESDEPWREFSARLARECAGKNVLLVGFAQSPAAEFYLRRAIGDRNIIEIASVKQASPDPHAIVVTRLETAPALADSGWILRWSDQSLAQLDAPAKAN